MTKLNGLALVDLPEQPLPGADWVRVKTLLGGICGTDIGIIAQKQPPNSILQAFSSMPMALGHENVSLVSEVGSDVDQSMIGKRVCVEPTLCCEVRGITPKCARCQEGQFGACENFGSDGAGSASLPPGTSIGYNRATGGSFGESFIAHKSQLVIVPDGISDELAVLTDPLACSVHGALAGDLSDARSVLVYGAGVLGLGVIAALRAIGYSGRIDALDRSRHLGQLAVKFGADEFVTPPQGKAERFKSIADRTGASVQRARFGNYILSGGYDTVFDCVGSASSMNDSLKWTRSRGSVIMVGTAHHGVDLTPIWFKELTVRGVYGRAIEKYNGREISTYQLVHELMLAGKLDVGEMLTHKFPLSQYKQALWAGLRKAQHKSIKVAFDFR